MHPRNHAEPAWLRGWGVRETAIRAQRCGPRCGPRAQPTVRARRKSLKPATFTVNAGQLATLATGWTGTCPTVTVTSSNGWHTNFDNLVYDTPLADLTITSFVATNGTTASPPHLTLTVANQGTADAGPGTTFDIHVFADLGRPPTPGDIAYVAHIPVDRLAPGETAIVEGDASSPPGPREAAPRYAIL